MDATCTIQDSIHVFSLVYKYMSRILGTYHKTPVFININICSALQEGAYASSRQVQELLMPLRINPFH